MDRLTDSQFTVVALSFTFALGVVIGLLIAALAGAGS